jgi:hypothetical protein
METQLIPDLAQVRLDYKRSGLTAGSARRRSAYRPGRQVPDVAAAVQGEPAPIRLRAPGSTHGITLVAVPGPGSTPRDGELESLESTYSGTVRLVRPTLPLPGDGRGYLLGIRPDGFVGYRGPCAATPELLVWLRDALCLMESTAADREPAGLGEPQRLGEPADFVPVGREALETSVVA